MAKPSVYLAGPIKGQTFDNATNWREYATQQLQPEIEAYSPLRGKDFLKQHITVFGHPLDGHPLLSAKGTMGRDLFDVLHRDAVLMNLKEAPLVSIGSVFELAWAYEHRKPLVLVIESAGELSGMAHNHAWILEAATFVVNQLDDGIAMIKAILLSQPGSTDLGFGTS